MKLLFYKPSFSWPRSSGHDVHTYHLMRALGNLGASISLVTDIAPPAPAIDGLKLDKLIDLSHTELSHQKANSPVRPLEERFRRYWGVTPDNLSRFLKAVRSDAFDAVIVSGLQVLPMFLSVNGPYRIWYAADEWCWHHLSQVQPGKFSTWSQLKEAAFKGLYERAYRKRVDAAWLVSKTDAQWMRVVAGIGEVEVLQNGVDAEYYTPQKRVEENESVVFWGRLDFGPNIQALEWFSENIWRQLRQTRPNARLTVMGFNPGPNIFALQKLGGIDVLPDVEDIREAIPRHAAVILPFISGGGIKNKLLEAAAMGKPIVATDRVVKGLQSHPPVRIANSPAEWIAEITNLWDQPNTRYELGNSAREWVMREHDWTSVGKKAFNWLDSKIHSAKVSS